MSLRSMAHPLAMLTEPPFGGNLTCRFVFSFRHCHPRMVHIPYIVSCRRCYPRMVHIPYIVSSHRCYPRMVHIPYIVSCRRCYPRRGLRYYGEGMRRNACVSTIPLVIAGVRMGGLPPNGGCVNDVHVYFALFKRMI
jgi:hypothetical protein